MKPLRLVIIGFGRLGQACANQIQLAPDLQLAGIVEQPGVAPTSLTFAPTRVPLVTHVSEIADPKAALVCTPAATVLEVAASLLQRRLPLVECASLQGHALDTQRVELDRLARLHRVAAIVGAGWEPGVLDLFASYFKLLIPYGHTSLTHRPGVSLHHTAAIADMEGVAGVLCAELKGADGRPQRYVYVQLKKGADFARVSAAIENDPLFAGEKTFTFPVESVADLEREGHGVLLERRGTSGANVHEALLLEGRFNPISFTARIMVDAARQLLWRQPGAHLYLPDSRSASRASAC